MNTDGSFGAWLKQRRKALDLTQTELADQVGCTLTTVQKIEANLRRPSKQITERLVDVLVLSPDERANFVTFARRVVAHPIPLPIDLTSLMPPSNLPMQSTPFIGREIELSQIAVRLLDPSCRLLTLAGAGGIGKTRLALQAAADRIEDFADGVYFVALAPVGLSTLIATAIASVLQLAFDGQHALDIQVVNYLRGKHMLLVIDNYEHLLPEIGLVNNLLANAPRLKILATSRERLNLHEEWLLPIEGLPFPTQTTNEEISSYSAVQLFVQTARRLQPNFLLKDHEESVVEICQVVEGMPLAIELAVTWLRVMPCHQIAGQIRHNLDFLVTQMRNIPDRHRSLRAVFDHSWRLLSEVEQGVFMRLSVFRGGIDSEAAEQVAGASLSKLASMLDKSLLRLNASGRYEVHELLRQFAADKLQETNETAETQRRHFQHFLGLAEQLDRHYFGPQEVVWMDRLETELDNFRAALEWAESVGDAASGLQLATALGWFWNRREYWKEGREWLEKFRASNSDIPIETRAKAIYHGLELGHPLGDYVYNTGLCEEGFRLVPHVKDPRLLARLLMSLGFFGYCPGVSAEDCLNQALVLFRKLGDHWGMSESLSRLAVFFQGRGDFVQAVVLQDEAIHLARQAGCKSDLAWMLFMAAVTSWHEGGDNQRTESTFREALALFQELRCKGGISGALTNLGAMYYRRGDDEQARSLFQSSLRLSLQLGERYNAISGLLRLAHIFCKRGELNRGARLLGIVNELLPEINNVSSQTTVDGRQAAYASGLAVARAGLGEEVFAAVFAEGQQMSLEQAIAYALD